MDVEQMQEMIENLQSSMQEDMRELEEKYRKKIQELSSENSGLKKELRIKSDRIVSLEKQLEAKTLICQMLSNPELEEENEELKKEIQTISSANSKLKKALQEKSEQIVMKSERDLKLDKMEMELTSRKETLDSREMDLKSKEDSLKRKERTITSREAGVQASKSALDKEKSEFELRRAGLENERNRFLEEKQNYKSQVEAAASSMIFTREFRRDNAMREQMEQEKAEFRDKKTLLSAAYELPFVLLLCYILVFTFNYMAPGTAFEEQIGFTFYIAWQCIRVIGLGLYYTAFFPLYSGIWIPEAPWEVALQVVIGAIILMGFVFMAVRIVRFVIIPVIKFWRDKKIFDLTTLAILTVLMSLAAISTAPINSFALAMGVFVLYIAIRSGCSYDWHTVKEFVAIIRGKKSQDA